MIDAIVQSVFLLLACGLMLHWPTDPGSLVLELRYAIQDVRMWGFGVLAVALSGSVVYHLAFALAKDELTLDRARNVVLRNGRELAKLNEVTGVEIVSRRLRWNNCRHQPTLVLKSGKRLGIESGGSLSKVRDVAGRMADIAGVEFTQKWV